MTTFTDCCPSPLGILQIAVDDCGRLLRIDLPDAHRAEPGEQRDSGRCAHVRTQLDEYFAGTRTQFTLDLAPAGTDFQQRAWLALQAIPFGRTATYAEQAARLGQPTATRAVGAANGRNPIPIVVPCHRVIGSDGSLTGFGGGLASKRLLLEHEARVLAAGTVAATAG
jgi:methylated-DNA-[protein]-cysteine S-methyltransferase